MTAVDHAAEAQRLLTDPGWDDPINVAHAQVHAALEQAKWLREIADQLDVRARAHSHEIWLAHYDDWSGFAVFHDEISARRHAGDRSPTAVLRIETGEDLREQAGQRR